MNANLVKKKKYHESPHIIIRRSYNLISDNSIVLKKPTISENALFYRKIFYEVDRVGKNVVIYSKNRKYKNIKIDETSGNKSFFLVHLKYIREFSGLIFFDELGKRMDLTTIEKQEKAYVLLAMVEKTYHIKKNRVKIDDSDIDLANKLWINQIKTDGSFHFNTTGKIFGLGFGPKYSINQSNNLSIGQFAEKKRLFRTTIHANRLS